MMPVYALQLNKHVHGARGEITTGQAVAVAHMAACELGGSAYGIRAVRAASSEDRRGEAGYWSSGDSTHSYPAR